MKIAFRRLQSSVFDVCERERAPCDVCNPIRMLAVSHKQGIFFLESISLSIPDNDGEIWVCALDFPRMWITCCLSILAKCAAAGGENEFDRT
jgi:hypothetical protein